MATSDSGSSGTGASSLALPIPERLKCKLCQGLTRDPAKLTCCDINICGSCRKSLPGSCPYCGHSPLLPSDSVDNLSLRTTVNVFIKHLEKRTRDAVKEPNKGGTAITVVSNDSLADNNSETASQITQNLGSNLSPALPLASLVAPNTVSNATTAFENGDQSGFQTNEAGSGAFGNGDTGMQGSGGSFGLESNAGTIYNGASMNQNGDQGIRNQSQRQPGFPPQQGLYAQGDQLQRFGANSDGDQHSAASPARSNRTDEEQAPSAFNPADGNLQQGYYPRLGQQAQYFSGRGGYIARGGRDDGYNNGRFRDGYRNYEGGFQGRPGFNNDSRGNYYNNYNTSGRGNAGFGSNRAVVANMHEQGIDATDFSGSGAPRSIGTANGRTTDLSSAPQSTPLAASAIADLPVELLNAPKGPRSAIPQKLPFGRDNYHNNMSQRFNNYRGHPRGGFHGNNVYDRSGFGRDNGSQWNTDLGVRGGTLRSADGGQPFIRRRDDAVKVLATGDEYKDETIVNSPAAVAMDNVTPGPKVSDDGDRTAEIKPTAESKDPVAEESKDPVAGVTATRDPTPAAASSRSSRSQSRSRSRSRSMSRSVSGSRSRSRSRSYSGSYSRSPSRSRSRSADSKHSRSRSGSVQSLASSRAPPDKEQNEVAVVLTETEPIDGDEDFNELGIDVTGADFEDDEELFAEMSSVAAPIVASKQATIPEIYKESIPDGPRTHRSDRPERRDQSSLKRGRVEDDGRNWERDFPKQDDQRAQNRERRDFDARRRDESRERKRRRETLSQTGASITGPRDSANPRRPLSPPRRRDDGGRRQEEIRRQDTARDRELRVVDNGTNNGKREKPWPPRDGTGRDQNRGQDRDRDSGDRVRRDGRDREERYRTADRDRGRDERDRTDRDRGNRDRERDWDRDKGRGDWERGDRDRAHDLSREPERMVNRDKDRNRRDGDLERARTGNQDKRGPDLRERLKQSTGTENKSKGNNEKANKDRSTNSVEQQRTQERAERERQREVAERNRKRPDGDDNRERSGHSELSRRLRIRTPSPVQTEDTDKRARGGRRGNRNLDEDTKNKSWRRRRNKD